MTFNRLTRAELESRRLLAVADLKAGVLGGTIARRYGVSRTTLVRWRKAIARGEDMKARKAPGRPCRLTPEQVLAVCELYQGGPGRCGFALLWQAREFRDVIYEAIGVAYHVDHVARIMHALGWADYEAVDTREAIARDVLALVRLIRQS